MLQPQSDLNGNIMLLKTTISLDNTEGFLERGTILIGEELITYTGISSSGLTGAF